MSGNFNLAIGGFFAVIILTGIIAFQIFWQSTVNLRLRGYLWLFGIGFAAAVITFFSCLIWG